MCGRRGGAPPDSVPSLQLVMRCLLDAVSHMHGHGISHRDLKLENLVLARPRDLHSVTIVDFGLAKAARARERMEGVTGTLWYTAPEILLGEPYSPLVDLWSMGVVMYLLLTGALSALSPPGGACARLCRASTGVCAGFWMAACTLAPASAAPGARMQVVKRGSCAVGRCQCRISGHLA